MKIRNPNSEFRNLIILFLILTLSAFLRFYLLDGQSFWNDEGNSARIAERSWQLITDAAAGDIHPPLYYYLLHVWRGIFGSTEFALRSLSALLGVGLVGLTFLVGRAAFNASAGLLAAFLAAINPFQIYYSQEARMYMLLAVIGAAATFVLLRLLEDWARGDQVISRSVNRVIGRKSALSVIIDHVSLIILYAAGLYTHYAFPFILVTHFLIIATWVLVTRARWHYLVVWIGLVVAAGVLFLPWLPTAIHQISTWPSARTAIDAGPMLLDTLRLYVAGPTLPTSGATIAILACGFFILVGFWNPQGFDERRMEAQAALPYALRLGAIVLWWLVPVALIFAFGLFKDSYLKFFLAGSAAFCILLAHGIANAFGVAQGALSLPRELAGRRLWSWAWVIVMVALVVLIAVPTGMALRNYYFDPVYARDNYRGIAQRILQNQRADDAVLLNSANQWEVFTYYYPDGPNVYPLPRQRPLDKAATEAELASIASRHPRLFVLYWGDGEADPQKVIESWLDTHTYKATEQWINSVRFVTYAVPRQLSSRPERPSGARFGAPSGAAITLDGITLPATQLRPGDILQLDLFWRTDRPLNGHYKVFVHLLDAEGRIVAQTDREPGGGLNPTTNWRANELVVDRYGVLIPPESPAGTYAVEIGLYGLDGARLKLDTGGDSLRVAEIQVTRPAGMTSSDQSLQMTNGSW